MNLQRLKRTALRPWVLRKYDIRTGAYIAEDRVLRYWTYNAANNECGRFNAALAQFHRKERYRVEPRW